MRLPKGFLSSGIRAGLRKKRPDLALIVAEEGASAAAIFTRNRFLAAPVVLSQQALARSGGRVRAVVVNAGCANAITGRPGMEAARRVRDRAAELLDCPASEIFLASTGVIGVQLDDAKLRRNLPAAIARLSPSGVEATSHAILTTDVGPKVAQASFTWNGRRARIVGIAKGAGMIHPDMATMLAFLMTDAPATPAFLRRCLREAADRSFNAISVDGDTSTNDTVLLMASGKLGGDPMDGDEGTESFRAALARICRELAWMIVRDGEGATRVLRIEVSGARSDADAKLAAHAVGTSPLVKTAVHGGDPNWGRILAAVGRSGAKFSRKKISLTAGKIALVTGGEPARYREKDAARAFSKDRVDLQIDLGLAGGSAVLMVSDLGHDYVSINADYRS
ncbi:MAG TPA: bifunctional glutamate N-acetyltransferase/amino-acid acetyltransferase ArgJ [Thermoanaerobaculia bacterium]|nr:bifunctional glutamate N-acetyltransferase/amino-acid acetyltransferase ArgJ [Thermoanaerobaculia bacterium]